MKNLLLLLCLCGVVWGANPVWDGSAADSLWSTAANWSTNSVPAADDSVTFNTTSSFAVKVTGSTNTLGAIKIDGYSGKFVLSGGNVVCKRFYPDGNTIYTKGAQAFNIVPTGNFTIGVITASGTGGFLVRPSAAATITVSAISVDSGYVHLRGNHTTGLVNIELAGNLDADSVVLGVVNTGIAVVKTNGYNIKADYKLSIGSANATGSDTIYLGNSGSSIHSCGLFTSAVLNTGVSKIFFGNSIDTIKGNYTVGSNTTIVPGTSKVIFTNTSKASITNNNQAYYDVQFSPSDNVIDSLVDSLYATHSINQTDGQLKFGGKNIRSGGDATFSGDSLIARLSAVNLTMATGGTLTLNSTGIVLDSSTIRFEQTGTLSANKNISCKTVRMNDGMKVILPAGRKITMNTIGVGGLSGASGALDSIYSSSAGNKDTIDAGGTFSYLSYKDQHFTTASACTSNCENLGNSSGITCGALLCGIDSRSVATLLDQVKSNLGDGYGYFRLGASSNTTTLYITRFDSLLATNNKYFCEHWLFSSANDARFYFPVDSVRKNYNRIIDTSIAHHMVPKLSLVAPGSSTAWVQDTLRNFISKNKLINYMLYRLAIDSGYYIADTWHPFAILTADTNDYKAIASLVTDGLHYTTAGYQALADQWVCGAIPTEYKWVYGQSYKRFPGVSWKRGIKTNVTVVGDADSGSLAFVNNGTVDLDVEAWSCSGDSARFLKATLSENDGNIQVYYRKNATDFLRDSATPAWALYTAPVSVDSNTPYCQFRLKGTGIDTLATFTILDSAGLPLPPTITSQPKDSTVDDYDSVSFTCAATGTEPLLYQWYTDSSSYVGIDGANTATLRFRSILARTGSHYFCVVTDVNGSTSTDTAELTVTPVAPTITMDTLDTLYNDSTYVIAPTVIASVPRIYQWFRNSTPLTGDSAYLIVADTTWNGDTLVLEVHNAFGDDTARTIIVTVDYVPPRNNNNGGALSSAFKPAYRSQFKAAFRRSFR